MEELGIERNTAGILHLQMDRPWWRIGFGRFLNEGLQAIMFWWVHIAKEGNSFKVVASQVGSEAAH